MHHKMYVVLYKLILCLIRIKGRFDNSSNESENIREYRYQLLAARKTIFLLNTSHVFRAYKRSKKKIFVVNLYGLFGDLIAAEPIARFLKNKFPESKIKWIVDPKYKCLLENNPFIDEIVLADCLTRAETICESEKNVGSVIVDCLFNGRVCEKKGSKHVNLINPQITNQTYFLYGGLLESFCLAAGLPPLQYKPKIWLNVKNPISRFLSGKRYVAVHAVSQVPSKIWSWEKWKYIVRNLIDEGFVVVELGTESHIVFPHDRFFDATQLGLSIAESVAILRDANYFIGIDSSFAHVANALDIPSVIILGQHANFMEYSPFSDRSIKRKIVRTTDGLASEVSEQRVLSAFHDLSKSN